MRERTKKPHFVPAAYTKFWDFEGKPEKSRKSRIYWTDGKKTGLSRVDKIAVQSGLYSLRDPNAAEDFFSEFERNWSKLIWQIKKGNAPRKDILASMLLLQSSFFLLRNPKFENESEEERIEIYEKVSEGFFQAVLMDGKMPAKSTDEEVTDEEKREVISHLQNIWSCHLLPSQDEPWITSDNPVLTLTINDITPALIFLPITPDWALLALKSGVVGIDENKITAQDTEYLNSYTVINSIRHVYSNTPFEEADIKSIAKWFDRRPESKSWISETEIHMEPFKYPVMGMELSFLKIDDSEE